jgi:glutamyl-tRNA reductase
MQQQICLIGLNHRKAPVDVREKFALDNTGNRDLGLTSTRGPVRELVVLSTCNRVEILLVGDPGSDHPDSAIRAWAGACGRDPDELQRYVYTLSNLDAVRHVFRVASSLDSMVLGEPQILGQLKEAYGRAVEEGTTSAVINRLMHKAFSVAKRIRTETRISQNAVSVSYAAVELAKEIFADLGQQKAMLIGAGEMAELAAAHFLNAGVRDILVANRTYARAQELAKRFRGRAVPFAELLERLPEVDIVLTSTGATSTVIHSRDMGRVLKKRKHRPMFFIDIAVPRDVDPDLNRLDNVYLYDIDDLRGVVENNLAQRKEEAELAGEIIGEEVSAFDRWLRSLELKPTIVDMLNQGEAIARKELDKTLKNLGPDAGPEVQAALETLARSLSRKFYHHPITFLKRKAMDEDSVRYFISLTRRMFDLDSDRDSQDSHDSKSWNRS